MELITLSESTNVFASSREILCVPHGRDEARDYFYTPCICDIYTYIHNVHFRKIPKLSLDEGPVGYPLTIRYALKIAANISALSINDTYTRQRDI